MAVHDLRRMEERMHGPVDRRVAVDEEAAEPAPAWRPCHRLKLGDWGGEGVGGKY